MKNKIQNQKGAMVFEIIVGVLVLAMASVVGYTVYQNQKVPKTESVQTVTKKDPYAGWQTFTSKVNGLTFKYPADWKNDIKYEKFDANYANENGKITSPNGFAINVANNPAGLGGGCDDTIKTGEGACPLNVVYSAVPVSNVEKTHLIKYYMLDAGSKADLNRKLIGLSSNTGQEDSNWFDQKEHQGFPPYLVVAKPDKSESSTAYIYGSYPETNPNAKLSPEKYYALPDLKSAELAFKSMKFE